MVLVAHSVKWLHSVVVYAFAWFDLGRRRKSFWGCVKHVEAPAVVPLVNKRAAESSTTWLYNQS